MRASASAVVLLAICTGCASTHATAQPSAAPTPDRAVLYETTLLDRYTVPIGKRIRVDVRVAKLSADLTDGIVLYGKTRFYKIVWQGDGVIVIYAGSRRSSALHVVAATSIGRSDASVHSFSATLRCDARTNHVRVFLDGTPVLRAVDGSVHVCGKPLRVSALVNGFLESASVQE